MHARILAHAADASPAVKGALACGLESPRDFVLHTIAPVACPGASTEGGMTGIECAPLTESELSELECVMERHKTLIGISQTYGVFTSFCIPRLLTTFATSSANSSW